MKNRRPGPGAGCTASRWPPNCLVSAEQTLRLYEQRGLLTPARTAGGTRRYSDDDLDRLQRITELLAAGVNVAGIAQIFDLEARNTQLESTNTQLMSDNARLESGQRSVTPEGRRSTGKKRTR